MGSHGTDYVDVIIVAFLWGTTNPFLRKGTVEEDEKRRLLEEEEHEQAVEGKDNPEKYNGLAISDNEAFNDDMCNEEASAPLSSDIESSYSYQSTCELDVYSANNTQLADGDIGEELVSIDNSSTTTSSSLLSHTTPPKSPNDYSLYQDHAKVPTSYTKGLLLQTLSKCCHCPNEMLANLSKFHPRILLRAFLSSMLYELSKFTKPKIAIPFLFNQCSAVFYYKIIATSDLTNVAYCQAMSMAVEGIVSYLLGERMSHPWRGFGGAFIVMIGVGICLLSKDIEHWLNSGVGADAGDANGNDYDQRLLLSGAGDGDYNCIETLWQPNSEHQSQVFKVSPFVCWYALCGVVHWFMKLFGQ